MHQRIRGQHQHVHRIAITGNGFGDVAIVGRIAHAGCHEAVDEQGARLLVPLVLYGVGILRDFDDDVEFFGQLLAGTDAIEIHDFLSVEGVEEEEVAVAPDEGRDAAGVPVVPAAAVCAALPGEVWADDGAAPEAGDIEAGVVACARVPRAASTSWAEACSGAPPCPSGAVCGAD